jgi:hypothetical protein
LYQAVIPGSLYFKYQYSIPGNMKTFILILFSIFFFFQTEAQIIINEYSLSNLSSFTDNYQKYEDWFELRNTGNTTVNLNGYYLSDDPGNPMKFQIPGGINMLPGSFYRVWASGRNELIMNSLHTNFKLSQTKDSQEYIVFSSPDGTVLDQIALNKTMKEHSRGRSADDDGQWVVFTSPTPGNANTGNDYVDYAPKPVMSLSAGFYNEAITIEMTASNPDLDIRYTINGNEPTASSPLYSAPITISQNTIVNARCFSDDPSVLKGWIEFNTYFIGIQHTLPVISVSAASLDELLNGDQGLIPFGTFEYFNKNGVRTTTGYGEYNEHGQDSWVHPQRSIDYITRDECGYNYAIRDTIISITDRDEFQRIIIRAAGDDNYPGIDSSALLRDMFVQNTAQLNGMHLDVRKGEKCVMYVNGQYWGVYGIREKVSDHDFTDFYYGQDKYHVYFLLLWGGSWAEYGGQEAWDDWNDLHDFIKFNDMSNQENFDYVKTRLDYTSLVDYIIINSFVVCSDWINWNVGWWRGTNPEGGHQKWGYILWDEDATFNHYINYTGLPATDPTVSPCFPHDLMSDPEEHILLLNRLRTNAEFNQYYISRYVDLYNTTFKPEKMIAYLDEIAAKMTPEMSRHVMRWGGSMLEWARNVQKIRNFITARYAYLPEGLQSCFDLNGQYAYQVQVDPPETGIIELNSLRLESFPWEGTYFGGLEVNLKAIPANANIEFDYWEIPNHNVFPDIDSAAVHFNPAMNDNIIAHFKYKTYADSLVINEINYNAAETFDPGDWVEVYNPHPYTLNISGWVFKDEDDTHAFTFPQGTTIEANGYLVLCTNGVAFASLFPEVDNFIGDTGFGLAGGGELIRIYNPEGTLIDQVTYDDVAPWPTEPDGNGPTLELIKPTLDNALAESWMASPLHGTPGAENSQLVGISKLTDQPVICQMRVIPNPVNTTATVQIEGVRVSANDQLYLTNMLGTTIRVYPLSEGTGIQISLEGLSTGVYLLHYQNADGRATQQKIIH